MQEYGVPWQYHWRKISFFILATALQCYQCLNCATVGEDTPTFQCPNDTVSCAKLEDKSKVYICTVYLVHISLYDFVMKEYMKHSAIDRTTKPQSFKQGLHRILAPKRGWLDMAHFTPLNIIKKSKTVHTWSINNTRFAWEGWNNRNSSCLEQAIGFIISC